jgi:hypothetical protein
LKRPKFDIARFAPAKAALLGEGVWGRVYDLGDGTVLKIARDKSAGIGSGRRKVENEYAALTMLSMRPALKHLVPRPLGHGGLPANLPLAAQGFDLWLRSEKKSGRRLDVEYITGLSSAKCGKIAQSAGIALACLHREIGAAMKEAGRLLSAPGGKEAYAAAASEARQLNDELCEEAATKLAEARDRIPAEIRAMPAHNDFNISNLLFTSEYEVCAILDFAEWGVNFPEKDISDLVNELPELAVGLITAYQQEAEFQIDPKRLTLGIAENALYGAIIAAKNGDMEGADSSRKLLAKIMTGKAFNSDRHN